MNIAYQSSSNKPKDIKSHNQKLVLSLFFENDYWSIPQISEEIQEKEAEAPGKFFFVDFQKVPCCHHLISQNLKGFPEAASLRKAGQVLQAGKAGSQ